MTVSLLAFPAEAQTGYVRKWPLRNGDFSASQGWGRPTDWQPATNSGKHNFTTYPASPFWGRPGAAVIETTGTGSGYYYQKVVLLEGDYRFSVDVSGKPGARAGIGFSFGDTKLAVEPAPVPVGPEAWQRLELSVKNATGEAFVSLFTETEAGKTVAFRRAELTVERLASAPVPFEDGPPLGAVVLPPDPTPAEQYAAYELQRYVFRMTGCVPGLKGRDAVHPGRTIVLGRAADPELTARLGDLPEDSYLLDSTGATMTLSGQTDQGTLYAVYDFLDKQGCRWVVPGELGEVVPRRTALGQVESRIEAPDYICRGVMFLTQEFFPGGGEEFGWIHVNMDDYFDWYLRNRMNALWTAGTQIHDFAAHRAHGWVQTINHSYNSIIAPHQEYFASHPDWYPLVDDERRAVCHLAPYFANQLCVSNPELRDYTVKLILEYFRSNPRARAFPLNPMDGPSLWCECTACKALDPPGIDWSRHATEGHVEGMADRALNYANAVAERVSRVYPDKWIEMYAYGYTLDPPVREKAHRNVFIKYANLRQGEGNGPLGRSMLDPDAPVWPAWRRQLDGWKQAGATMAFYNYMEWVHPDVTLFWFYNTVDVLKSLNRTYNCRILAGETENNILVSSMVYNVLARAAWDVDIDYRAVVRDLCDRFYGPLADDLYAYNMLMDEAVRSSDAWEQEGWRPNDHLYMPLDVLEKGHAMLETAAQGAAADEVLTQRLAYARLGHAYLTYVRTLTEPDKTFATEAMARRAFDEANAIRLKHNIMVKLPSVRQLKTFYYPPVVSDHTLVMELPATWDFRTDPSDVGLAGKWFRGDVDAAWSPISIEQAWTSQDVGRGYHGAAWYHVSFRLPDEPAADGNLVLHFGAVDGVADIFLDGVRIGEQHVSPSVMWDRPFTIPLPADLDPAAPHYLVMRVSKQDFAAGIWKPVSILGPATMTRPAVVTAEASGLDSRENSTLASTYEVRIEKDVQYLGAGRPLLMDIYRPVGTVEGPLPAILYMFGGGWCSGDRTDGGRGIRVCKDIAERGYVCASIDYTLSTAAQGGWPQAFHECKSAVQFLRIHAAEYGIDPDAIGSIGCSAGGHLAALLGTAGPDAGLEPNGPYTGVSSRVQAVAALYGPHDLTTFDYAVDEPPWTPRTVVETFVGASFREAPERFRLASPIAHIDGDEPPFLLIHGSEDTVVPVKQAIDMHKRLQSAGVTSELIIVEGAGHSFDLRPDQKDLRPSVVGFFDRWLKGSAKPQIK